MSGFGPKVWVAIFLTMFIWSFAFLGVRVAVFYIEPITLMAARFLISLVTLILILPFNKLDRPKGSEWGYLMIAGILGFALYHLAFNYGARSVNAPTASFIIALSPILSALLGTMILKESLSKRGWMGVGVSFSGAALIAMGQGQDLDFHRGAAFLTVSAFATTIYSFVQKYKLIRLSSFSFVFWSMLFGNLIGVLFWRDVAAASTVLPWNILFIVLFLGSFPLAIAHLLWAYVIRQIPISKASPFGYSLPVMTIILAWLILGELPTSTSILGGMLIIGGLFILHYGSRRAPVIV